VWDPRRLEQVVTNLIDNAIKYGRGKPVSIHVSAHSDDVARLIVRDQGIGIAADRLPHIFDRFVRATAEPHGMSFGLGLWIVRKVVTALGGSVSVDSAVDRGSTFTVELPRGGPPSRREPRIVSAPPPPPAT
jgi:signal transduction histidine kinase